MIIPLGRHLRFYVIEFRKLSNVYIFAYSEHRSFSWVFPALLYYILALFGIWIDFNFKSLLDIAVYIQRKLKNVQSLQSSYFLVFYHFGFETTTLTFSRIFDFDDATNLFLSKYIHAR
jgi:hypothetical protein